MKTMHIHVGVQDLQSGIEFYSSLFGAPPEKQKHDYAKWILEDPRLNFAISTRSGITGVNHLGIQVEGKEELEQMRTHWQDRHLSTYDDGKVKCCYSESDKSWIVDPAGVAWEAFHTMGDVQYYASQVREDRQCCA